MAAKITFKKETPVRLRLIDIPPGEFFVSWAHNKRSRLQQRTNSGAVVVEDGTHSKLDEYVDDAVFEIVPVEIIVG